MRQTNAHMRLNLAENPRLSMSLSTMSNAHCENEIIPRTFHVSLLPTSWRI